MVDVSAGLEIAWSMARRSKAPSGQERQWRGRRGRELDSGGDRWEDGRGRRGGRHRQPAARQRVDGKSGSLAYDDNNGGGENGGETAEAARRRRGGRRGETERTMGATRAGRQRNGQGGRARPIAAARTMRQWGGRRGGQWETMAWGNGEGCGGEDDGETGSRRRQGGGDNSAWRQRGRGRWETTAAGRTDGEVIGGGETASRLWLVDGEDDGSGDTRATRRTSGGGKAAAMMTARAAAARTMGTTAEARGGGGQRGQ
ncbi:hypothetical protein B0H15DRAFT_804146 [Mycena belliarum]|uniref:Uncharacterized protein n=1 Tax=Mycena belliarum TaxID=1033014 RepID=A0AAD6XME1_9AGAR|nr:hypothetical protein B0H15DRAFT_804146 [Mycena belliae]